MTIKAFVWSTPIRKVSTSVMSFLALFAALGGAVHAWPDVEPLLPAQRYYVVEQVGQVRPVINQILKWRSEDRLDDLRKERAVWESKMPTETNPQAREVGRKRLREIDRATEQAKQRLKELSQ